MKQQEEAKKNGTGKLPQNKLRIVYANSRGIKSKMLSLKHNIIKTMPHLAITETLLKNNEKVKIYTSF